MSRPTYLQVAEDEGKEVIELPSEDDGTLLLSTLSAQFPGLFVSGLKYRNPETGTMRGVRLAEGTLHPPEHGWGNNVFYCVFPKGATNRQDEEVTGVDEVAIETVGSTTTKEIAGDDVVSPKKKGVGRGRGGKTVRGGRGAAGRGRGAAKQDESKKKQLAEEMAANMGALTLAEAEQFAQIVKDSDNPLEGSSSMNQIPLHFNKIQSQETSTDPDPNSCTAIASPVVEKRVRKKKTYLCPGEEIKKPKTGVGKIKKGKLRKREDADKEDQLLGPAVPLWCICKEPEHGNMIQCKQCDMWWHFECVEIPDEKYEEMQHIEWMCPNCTPSNPAPPKEKRPSKR